MLIIGGRRRWRIPGEIMPRVDLDRRYIDEAIARDVEVEAHRANPNAHHPKAHAHSVADGSGAIASDQDIEVTAPANGLILRAPDGSRWRVTVDPSGVLSTSSI